MSTYRLDRLLAPRSIALVGGSPRPKSLGRAVLLGAEATVNGHALTRLPTRDAVLPILSVLAMAAREHLTLAELVRRLPLRAALSDRLTDVPAEKGAALAARLATDPAYAASFFAGVGEVAAVSTIDGPRFAL